MRNHILALLLALMAFGLTGCGDSNDIGGQVSGQQGNPRPNPTVTPTPGTQAQLRIATMALEYSTVEVLVNGTEVQSDAEFGDVTDYFTVPAGQSRIQVRATGIRGAEAPDDELTDVLDQTVTVNADTHNTVVISGILAEDNDSVLDQRVEGLRLLTLVDDVTPNANGVSVRFVNAIPFQQGDDARVETAEFELIAGPQDYNTASNYVDFTEALDHDWVNLILPEVGETWRFDTEEATNKPIFTAIRDALGGRPGNLSIFVTGNGNFMTAFVVIDNASEGGETFIFVGDLVQYSSLQALRLRPC